MHLTRDQIATVFGLKPQQGITIALFGFLVLCVTNFSVITFHFTKDTVFADPNAQASFAGQLKSWFSSPIFNTITLVVFWILIGLLAYSILYWAYSVYNEARNEIIVEKEYVSTKDAPERKDWTKYEIGLFAGLVVFAFLTVTVFFPLFSSWFVTGIFAIPTKPLIALLSIFGASLGMFLLLYSFKSLISTMLVLE